MKKITFSRKDTARHMLVYVGGMRVGYIHACYGKLVTCPTCKHVSTDYTKATSYALCIDGRCWCKGQLVPEGEGGNASWGTRKLRDVRAKAVEVLS